MAKAKKTITEPILDVAEETTIVEQPEEINKEVELEATTTASEPVYVPDIPAQAIEVEEEQEIDEILFLRNILRIQNDGGFGTHLNKLINDRIKALKNG